MLSGLHILSASLSHAKQHSYEMSRRIWYLTTNPGCFQIMPNFFVLLKYNLSTNDFNYLYIHLSCLFKPWYLSSYFLKPKLFALFDQALIYQQLHYFSSHRELIASVIVYLPFKIDHLTSTC